MDRTKVIKKYTTQIRKPGTFAKTKKPGSLILVPDETRIVVSVGITLLC